ncbi:iron-containing alcohol dehydrogenase [Spirochaeta cellobiosiphila]|uniref:iron-containing alcohol dehydrogenase n=1 Tax=Spirochaeta cellobiosiphila TaxID=504483 RepID=UPI0003FAFE1C|nr:iron-containing alcohol dehydrogenase [Spirochaeta cellobiosiphila]
MNNFEYYNPTRIIFGKDTHNQAGSYTAKYSKNILLHYGSSFVKQSGLLDKIKSSLDKANVNYTELGGVKPNPRLSLVHEGISICKERKIDFILALGGGSVIDSAKAIAMGVLYSGDVWDFYMGTSQPKKALPIGTILTIPAAGSESSTGTVITKEEGDLKRAVNSELLYPQFSILNPELAYSLPKYQVACGATDIMAHLMERYFTNTTHVSFIDRLLESTMITIKNTVPKLLKNSNDYDAWSQFMWAGTIAHNNLLNTGRVGDWASHDIEHEISGIYDVTHGAGLAVVFPAWMKYTMKHDINRFVQWASRVWDVNLDMFDLEGTACEGIRRLEEFYHSIGLGTRLIDLNIKDDRLQEMADKCTSNNTKKIGNFVSLDSHAIYEILCLAQ